MADLKKHCERTMKRYGVTGEDIHIWMDEPVRLFGSNHRGWRHQEDQVVPRMFVIKYGKELARYIMVDHLLLDGMKKSAREQVLELLAEEKGLTVAEAAKEIGRARSSAQRILQKLWEEGLASKEHVLIGIGGYKSYYRLHDPEKGKKVTLDHYPQIPDHVLTAMRRAKQ